MKQKETIQTGCQTWKRGGRGYICTLYKKITLCHSAVTHSCHLTPCDPTNALQRTKKKTTSKEIPPQLLSGCWSRYFVVRNNICICRSPTTTQRHFYRFKPNEKKTGCSYIMYQPACKTEKNKKGSNNHYFVRPTIGFQLLFHFLWTKSGSCCYCRQKIKRAG